MKYFIFDVETTGLDPQRHTITQLGYIRKDETRSVQTLLNIRPLDDTDINMRALAVQGKSLDQILIEGLEPAKAYQRLLLELGEWVDKFNKQDKFIVVGYNVRFDLEFLRAWFLKVDPLSGKFFGSWFHTLAIDIYSVAAIYLGYKFLSMPSGKLIDVAKAFGVKVDEKSTHNALYDAIIVEEIFNTLKEGIKK